LTSLLLLVLLPLLALPLLLRRMFLLSLLPHPLMSQSLGSSSSAVQVKVEKSSAHLPAEGLPGVSTLEHILHIKRMVDAIIGEKHHELNELTNVSAYLARMAE
ncbi:hypothetical protein FBU31_003523, partial [Coemansia sp. 'formosensis']